ncbi:DNA recombination protein RmuC [Agrobacterium rosae]|uniref:DNA recombination protein RmuC homolog n=2 Tax=Agrobacterium rosae TaxID=1972867 RepID=A0AAE5VRG2_9HYPH|nr:DNA recombination protein RmuC [Agrobacterium rosae]KAA3511047.1 DNA recombination protein RmuC [Agrobacterium rosae]KAA3518085.1 DNA recombination protein RmuC [Agrobacterium rosae]MCM2434382.1 DNA recombination protein RmuC [Agrobacterium rosae]MQB49664.1 DNA recombination protein RmuC [Agrobacterium rosae]POO54074.1 DNA recombination protein RmuC [Agrobacterium rosae]
MNIDLNALGTTAFSLGSLQISVGALLGILIAGCLIAAAFMWRKPPVPDQSRDEITELLRTQSELHGRIAAMTESLSARQNEMSQTLNDRLDGMSQRIGTTLTEQTRSTHENLSKLQERLAVIDAAQGNIQDLAKDVIGLQAILNNKQTRGAFGQARMEALIADALPSGAYNLQPTLSNGFRPDCTIRMPNNAPPLVIDAKFPLEAWNALKADDAPEAKRAATQQFRRDMEVHIRDVADKYLISGETQDTAFIFVPSESIFADIHQHFENLVQRAHRSRVVIVSPSLLMLSVQVIQSVLKDQRMREQAHLIQGEVAMLMDDVRRLDERTRKLQAHFGLVQKDVDMMLTSSDKVLARGIKIESLDFAPSQKEIAHLEAEQLRRVAEVRAGTAKLRVVDDE